MWDRECYDRPYQSLLRIPISNFLRHINHLSMWLKRMAGFSLEDFESRASRRDARAKWE